MRGARIKLPLLYLDLKRFKMKNPFNPTFGDIPQIFLKDNSDNETKNVDSIFYLGLDTEY